MTELLPEDLLDALTPAQAGDALKRAAGRYASARTQNEREKFGRLYAEAQRQLAAANRRDQAIQSEYGWDRGFGDDLLFHAKQLPQKLWTTGKGFLSSDLVNAMDFAGMQSTPVQGSPPPLADVLPLLQTEGEVSGDPIREQLGTDNLAGVIGEFGSPLGASSLAFKSLAGLAGLSTLGYMATAQKAGGVTPDLAKALADQRGGPLQHASPFKFDFFDLRHVKRGEGAIAYSPNAIYFSDMDMVRGTHPHYLSFFRGHDELPLSITTNTGDSFDMPLISVNELRFSGNPDLQTRFMDIAAEITENINSGIDDPAEWVTEPAVQMLLSRIPRASQHVPKGHVDPRDAVRQVLRNELADAERDFPQDKPFLDMERRVLHEIDIDKGEPYSYKATIRDDLEHELPIYNDPISEQPERYRENVERLARTNFEEWRAVRQEEIDEIQGSIDEWEEWLEETGGTDEQFVTTNDGFYPSEAPLRDVIRELKQDIAKKQRQLEMGYDPDQKFGEIVDNLKANHGDEGARRIMMEHGIPGSRNETYRSRTSTTTPLGAMAYIAGKNDRGFNYAIWDMDLVDELVRRETRGGEILEDTAEVVFRRKPARVSMEGNIYESPDEWQQKFIDLGNAQRGEPERAMLRVTHMTGGGIINPTVEHVGDLTHRMTEKTAFANGDMGYEFVKPKVDRALRMLRQGYGFEREFLENVSAMEQLGGRTRAQLDDALMAYADAHRELPVYNQMQRHARDSAIALGEQRWDDAANELEALKEILDQGKEAWVEAAGKID